MEKFISVLSQFEASPLWGWHFLVPNELATKFVIKNDRRVICTINDHLTIHCALMPNKGTWFVLLNNDNIKKIGLDLHQEIRVNMVKDTSEYGMPMADELNEVLLQDIIAFQYFQALTPGKQRTLMYIINKIKSTEIKIQKSLVIADHLVANHGKLDFKLLNEGFKESRKY